MVTQMTWILFLLINHKQRTNPQFTLAKGLVPALETSAFLYFSCGDLYQLYRPLS